MINGVIFDMDGLMFDTERMWATFWEPALAALGLEYKEGLAEAERGTAGETSRNIVRQFYGEDCDANAIIDSLHRVADEEFQKPVPKKPGLDELLAWLDANHIPMAVASSSRVHVIEGNLNNWGLTHYFKALVSGQQVKHSKPDPEIFLLAAEKLFLLPHLQKGKVWPHIYTLFLVVVGWAMFVGNDTGVSFGLLFQKLFIPSGGVSPLYFLRNYGVLLAVSVVCCTPLIEKIWDVLRRNVVTRCAAILTLLVISTAYVVGSTNSPFLYFNF